MGKEVEKVKKITATKRLEALEETVLGFQQRFMILADEIDKLSAGLMATTKTIDALLKATDSRKAVNDIIIKENVEEMTARVKSLAEQGAIIKLEGEDAAIGERAYIIARDLDSDGNVVNPRIHLAFTALPEEEKSLFLGKKVGEVVSQDAGSRDVIEILEIYDIAEIKEEKE